MESIQPDQLPPQSKEAEMAVIGAVLRDPDCLPDVLDLIQPADFYYHANRLVMETAVALRAEQLPVDLVILFERLKQLKLIEDVGGVHYLTELWEATPTSANAEHYAGVVRDTAVRRNLIHAATEVIRDAYERSGPAVDLAATAGSRLSAAGDRYASTSVASLDSVLNDVLHDLDRRSTREVAVTARPTGFIDLDQLTAGLHEGELITVGARPGVGKSAFALAIAESVARAGHRVLFVSLEMSKMEQGMRLLVTQSQVDNRRVRKGRLASDDVDKIVAGDKKLRGLPIFVDDNPYQTVTRIGATARKLHRKKPIGLIVVDYLQLIRPQNQRDPRHEQVAQQTRELKLMAKDLSCPVLLLAQLNRQVEEQHRRPRLSDLRESGAVEQDSDTVLMLHTENDESEGHSFREVSVIVAKQRNGPLGTVRLAYSGQTFRFANWSAEGQ